MDKEIGQARKKRWAVAFGEEGVAEAPDASKLDSVNRKATIVIEHLIQASDVSHTMQVCYSFQGETIPAVVINVCHQPQPHPD